MAKAPAGFAEFVDTRAPALARTSSLLEMDDAVAEQALVTTLGWSARRWRAISRDGNAEAEVRHRLYGDLAGHWKRSGFLDAVPAATAVRDNASAERLALASLTNRQRACVVLSVFESLNDTDIASLLRIKRGDVDPLTHEAGTQLRRAAGVPPDAPLLPLLNAAASREAPNELEARALAASGSGNRRGLAIAAVAVVATGAVVAGAVALQPEPDSGGAADAVAANIERWGIPAEPPLSRNLPTLVDEPIETASMAYISQGVPVVTDAATGTSRTVLSGRPTPEWYDGGVNGVLRPGPPWTQAVLSPDGAWLLLVQAQGRPQRAGEPSFGRHSPGDLYLVRISTGEVTPVRDANPAPQAVGRYSIADTVLAWAPGVGAFACVCDGRLSVFDLDKATPKARLKWATDEKFTDVAWGLEGLLGRRLSGGWVSQTRGGTAVSGLGDAAAVAASKSVPAVYLSVGITSIYALGADTTPDGGRCVLWDARFTSPVEVTPVPERDGRLCTPVALQPGRSGVLLALKPDQAGLESVPSYQPRPEPVPLDVVTVDSAGVSTVISTFPPGTTTASFAANLVG